MQVKSDQTKTCSSNVVQVKMPVHLLVAASLPAGFGTPRWYRPLAAADPAAWEAWLADLAAVHCAQLQQQAEASQQQGQQPEASQQQQQQQQQQVLEQVADFTINLACAMR
jgi:hypothetical protein